MGTYFLEAMRPTGFRELLERHWELRFDIERVMRFGSGIPRKITMYTNGVLCAHILDLQAI